MFEVRIFSKHEPLVIVAGAMKLRDLIHNAVAMQMKIVFPAFSDLLYGLA